MQFIYISDYVLQQLAILLFHLSYVKYTVMYILHNYNNLIIIFCFSALEESCEKCISTRVCKNNTGTYLRFSKHYKPSLSMVPCDLYLNNDMVQSSITEEMFVEISPQSNYSIRCPICDHEIYYEIPHFTFFNIPYCSIVTGMYCNCSIQYINT